MEYSYQQGDGTQDNPYVIMRPAQLDHMHNVLIKDEMVYFVLGADIDMTGYNWKQLNSADNTYRYRINLDGRGHIISNLTPDGSKHNPSFFGVLCGECRNVGFLNTSNQCWPYSLSKCFSFAKGFLSICPLSQRSLAMLTSNSCRFLPEAHL